MHAISRVGFIGLGAMGAPIIALSGAVSSTHPELTVHVLSQMAGRQTPFVAAVVPLVLEFMAAHPQLQVDLSFEDRYTDLAEWSHQFSPGEEIRAYCRGKVATYKIPKYYKFVDSFPMTVSGKIQKFKLREKEWQGREKRVN